MQICQLTELQFSGAWFNTWKSLKLGSKNLILDGPLFWLKKNIFSNFSKNFFIFNTNLDTTDQKFIYSVSNTKEKIPCIIKIKILLVCNFILKKSR